MNESTNKKGFQGNVFTIVLATILLAFGGQILGSYIVQTIYIVILEAKGLISTGHLLSLNEISNNVGGLTETIIMYLVPIGIWIAALLWFLFKANRPLFKVYTRTIKGNTIPKLLLGFLIGFLMNSCCVVVAILHGDIELSYVKFEILPIIIIFISVFIQSSSEELICRGYMYQKLMNRYHKPALAIILNSSLFALLHLLNPGVNILAVLNILMIGIVFSLVVYYLDSLWMAMALHTAWNFTQNILYGLPNSGRLSGYSVFSLNSDTAQNSFAYDTGFGVESTLVALIIEIIACIILVLYGRKKATAPTDIWTLGDEVSGSSSNSL